MFYRSYSAASSLTFKIAISPCLPVSPCLLSCRFLGVKRSWDSQEGELHGEGSENKMGEQTTHKTYGSHTQLIIVNSEEQTRTCKYLLRIRARACHMGDNDAGGFFE